MRGKTSRLPVLMLAGAAIAAAAVTSPQAAIADAPGIQFTHEITVDPQRLAGEPVLAIAADGKQMYSSDPWGFSTTVSFSWKTEDGGAQWDNLHWFCPTNPLRPFCSRGGGDSEIQLGSGPGGTVSAGDQPQRAVQVDLNGLDTITCAYSTDGGKTYNISGGTAQLGTGHICNIAAGNNAPGSDRQWVAIWPKQDQPAGATADKAYMVYDTGETPPGGDASAYSLDGGANWSTGCTTTTGPSCLGGAGSVGTRPGPLLINTATGTLYEFMGLSNNGAEVNISCNGGASWAHKTITTGEFGATTNDFVVGTMDTAGGLYAAWTQDNGSFNGSPDPSKPWQVMYSYSTDPNGTTLTAQNSTGASGCTNPVQGGAWSTPVAINGPSGLYSSEPTVANTNATNVNFAVMPWIAAGTPGRVDVAYYGSTSPLPSDPSTQNETWYLHMSQTLNGQTAVPTFNDVQASETPMHTQSICFSGIGCTGSGNRNLSDFFEIRPDPQGRAVIVYVDDNNQAIGPPGAGFNGGPITSMVQQVSGPGLFANINGGVVSGATASLTQSVPGFSSEVTDPANDAPVPAHQQPNGASPAPGPNNDAADITDLKITNKDANTLAFTFTVKNLHGDPTTAITNQPVPHTGAMWLVTWHSHNLSSGAADDLWFASASVNNAGNMSYLAGRPVSIFSSSAPKAFQYAGNPTVNSAVSGAVSGNTIEIDVPLAAIGNAHNGDIFYGLTGYTEEIDPSTAAAASIPADVLLNGQLGIFDTADQTAPIDYAVGGTPASALPETPSVPIVVAVAAAAAAGAFVLRRRRSSGHITT